MDDLVQWLRAQLDADAARAIAASPGPWSMDGSGGIVDADGSRVIPSVGGALDGRVTRWPEGPVVDHVIAWDPTQVLREIDAKRRMVDAYLPPGDDPHPGLPCINFEGQDPADYDGYDSCSRHLEASKRLLHDDYVLRLLALPFEGRPGYQEGWAP